VSMIKGEITIFLALSLTIICGFILAILESARVAVIRMEIEIAMDMGIQSIFAEYNRELLERYDLFFIDTSYGEQLPSIEALKSHFGTYVQYNLEPYQNIILKRGLDYVRLKSQWIQIDDISIATDAKGEVFKRQALDYMRDKVGLGLLEYVMNNAKEIDQKGIWEQDLEGDRQKNENEINNVEIPPKQIDEDEWEEVTIHNPADEINALRGSGILDLVTEGELSRRSIHLSELPSQRNLERGVGIVGKAMEEGSISEVLFGEYIGDKFENYTTTKNEEGLSYEIEYILEGKETDVENLKGVVNRLLFIREAANVLYLFTDSQKQSEAEALAIAVAAFTGLPALVELIKISIILAWGYAESVVDVKTLLKGGKVPIMKTSKDWKVSIENLLHFQNVDTGKEENDKGLSYLDYLKIFLFLQQKEEKTMRCLDMIEVNMRQAMDFKAFRIDGCLEHLGAEMEVTSQYGYTYQIRRSYGYLQ
jgi:hypothetical protein